MTARISTLFQTLCLGCLVACGLAPAAPAQVVARPAHPVHPAYPAKAVKVVKARRSVAPVNTHPVVRAKPVAIVPAPSRRRGIVAATTNKGEERPRLRAALAALENAGPSMGDNAATLGQLRSAFADLNASAPSDVYHSHRYDAIECVRRAIKLLKEHQQTADVSGLTNEAIGHIQFCLAAPVK